MNFDITSMKQRAKKMVNFTMPYSVLGGLFMTIYNVISLFFISILEEDKILICLVLYFIISIFVTAPLIWFCMKAARQEKTGFSDIFLSFREKQLKVALVGIIKSLCIFAGMKLLFFGALFPFYWFRFAENIIKDEDKINIFAAMKKSMRLMKGHYVEIIKLDISLIGWWLLYIYTAGIAGV